MQRRFLLGIVTGIVLLALLAGCQNTQELIDKTQDDESPQPIQVVEVQKELPTQADLSVYSELRTFTPKYSYRMIETGDTLRYEGAERTVIVHSLSRPMNSWADFYARVANWDMGPLYLDDLQRDTYFKMHEKLNEAQVDDLFDHYTFASYRGQTTFVDVFTKMEQVGDAVRIRFETTLPRSISSINRWVHPVAIYAFPCDQNTIIYLRAPIDRTEYSGNLASVSSSRELSLSKEHTAMMKKVESMMASCGVGPRPLTASFVPKETLNEMGINERVYYRLNFKYDLDVRNIELSRNRLKFGLFFTNYDSVRLNNTNLLLIDIDAFDKGRELAGDNIEFLTLRSGDRNNFTTSFDKSHDWNIRSDLERVNMRFKPYLILKIDQENEIRYELAPIEREVLVLERVS